MMLGEGNPAAEAGLEAGDILLTANGHVLKTEEDAEQFIDGAAIAKVTYRRDEKTATVTIRR